MDVCEDLSGRQYEDVSSFRNAKINISGFTRVCSSVFLMMVYFRNKKAAANNHSGHYMQGLILPSYFQYILAMMCSNLFFGMMSMFVHAESRRSPLLSTELGVYHGFIEGLAFFLMQYGAGQTAIKKAFAMALVWGGATAALFYHILEFHNHDRFSKAYLMYFCYNSLVLVFYLIVVFAPIKYVYRRPALRVYGIYQIIETSSWIMVTSLLYEDVQFGYCLSLVTSVAMQGLLQSLFVYYALAEDSNYWQGIGNDSPLAGMWEIAADTAEGISDGLSSLSTSIRSLPLIHFGSITLHQQVGFVAGGTSRVYFGTLGHKEVALKILFAMELTPDVVGEFYNEVQILNTLQHRNVVTCLGISVMPPSISMVMEHCPYGSLFDHLYKARLSRRTQSKVDSVVGATTKLVSIINEFRSRLSLCMCTSSKSSLTAGEVKVSKTSMCVVNSPLSERKSEQESNKDRNSLYMSNRDSLDDLDDIESYLATTRVSLSLRQSLHDRTSMNSAHSGKSSNRESMRQSLTTGRKQRGLSMNQRMREKLTVRNLAFHPEPSATTTRKPVNTTAPYNTGGSVNNSAHVATAELPIFSFTEKLRMMHDVVAGILFLHQQGYIHCDIKSPNFLVANDFTVKVADLGEAREMHECCETEDLPSPALNWAPPEIINPEYTERNYTIHSDVYGVAMVLSEIILQAVPLDDSKTKLSEDTVYQKLVNDNIRPEIPSNFSEGIVEVLKKAWNTKPTDRASCEQLLIAIEKQILDMK